MNIKKKLTSLRLRLQQGLLEDIRAAVIIGFVIKLMGGI